MLGCPPDQGVNSLATKVRPAGGNIARRANDRSQVFQHLGKYNLYPNPNGPEGRRRQGFV